MNAVLWVSVVILSLALAYAIVFSEVTLALGNALSDERAGRGYQDAVTPPWQTWLSLLAYLLSFVVIALSWYEFGGPPAAASHPVALRQQAGGGSRAT